jgi:hypothetical protein
MRFHQLFRFCTWLSRRLISRSALRIYLCCVAIIILPAVAMRIQAILFGRQAAEITSQLSTLRIGITSKSEAISRIPSLAVVSSKDHDFDCSGDECFSVGIPNTKSSIWALVHVGDHASLVSLLHWWGVRYWTFDAHVNFTSGIVSGFSYQLKLSVPSAFAVPGVLSIGASSRRRLDGSQLDWQVDESPDYEVLH